MPEMGAKCGIYVDLYLKISPDCTILKRKTLKSKGRRVWQEKLVK